MLAPIGLMALIWVLSSRAGAPPSPNMDPVRFAERKIAHVMLYGALWASWWIAFRRSLAAIPAVLAIAYGAIDEIHQSTVYGRTGTARDVAIDAVGVALAIVMARATATRP